MAITITRATTARDWRDVRGLLDEQLCWVTEAVGFDVRTRQPAAGAEYTDPADHYARGAIVLARSGRQPAGIVGVCGLHDGVAELKRMYVRPNARRLGLGTGLVTEAVTAARELGYHELWLESNPATMAAALRLYRAAGFTDIPPYGTLGIDGLVTLGLVLDRARAVS